MDVVAICISIVKVDAAKIALLTSVQLLVLVLLQELVRPHGSTRLLRAATDKVNGHDLYTGDDKVVRPTQTWRRDKS